MTPSGIEPATFRFVAQNLNHCATAFSLSCGTLCNNDEGPVKELKVAKLWYKMFLTYGFENCFQYGWMDKYLKVEIIFKRFRDSAFLTL